MSHIGHRSRLKKRFAQGGIIEDYELLELFLFLLLPRCDVKPLAKNLLEKFGSLEGVIASDTIKLKQIPMIGDHVIHGLRILREIYLKIILEKIDLKQPIFNNWEAVLDYCRLSMSHETQEQLRVFFLDSKNRLLENQIMHQGTIDHTPIYPREILRQAINIGAKSLIIIHNHPNNDPTPSLADINATKDLAVACKNLGMILHDHLIIGKSGHVSLKTLCLI